jgi:hypothetical protein
MCTPGPSDSAVPMPDWAGLGMFSGEWRNIKGSNPVRVPPRARMTPRQRGFCFNVLTRLAVASL